ncbi:pantocin A family RiPP [Providencia rettgeri]|nr:pantocin A family RiPP [Providencia rettgeri]MBQ0368477.1 pantocin A family RiPP [Providencia rettgeri]
MINEIMLHDLTERISSISEEIAMYNEDEEIVLDE